MKYLPFDENNGSFKALVEFGTKIGIGIESLIASKRETEMRYEPDGPIENGIAKKVGMAEIMSTSNPIAEIADLLLKIKSAQEYIEQAPKGIAREVAVRERNEEIEKALAFPEKYPDLSSHEFSGVSQKDYTKRDVLVAYKGGDANLLSRLCKGLYALDLKV